MGSVLNTCHALQFAGPRLAPHIDRRVGTPQAAGAYGIPCSLVCLRPQPLAEYFAVVQAGKRLPPSALVLGGKGSTSEWSSSNGIRYDKRVRSGSRCSQHKGKA